jgi:hypothetical protein
MSVSCWTARKQDKKVSAEVEASHGAHDAGRYNKLLVDKVHLDPLTSFAGQIRMYHYKMTAPWMDNGARLLPAKLSMEYFAEVRRLKQDYQDKVRQFVHLYSTTLVQAARQRLGTMYNPGDYPASSDLFRKFDVEVDIQPIPDGQDFRVDISDAERARIAQEIGDKVAERTHAAQRDAWARIREAVTAVESRLSTPKGRIYDTLIGNVETLVRILPGLNIANDPRMDQVCREVTDRLIVDPQRLRDSISSRKRVAEAAREILGMMPNESALG